MITKKVSMAVVGGGPAGLAAAVEARRLGVDDVLLLERDVELGGILNQCIHDGFGLLRFGRQLSGAQYAQMFVDELREGGIEALTGAMVTDMAPDRVIHATHKDLGTVRIEAGSIVLAMGCRERTRNQVRIVGSRPAGVLTAGAVQKYINISGYLPGSRAVILGSGDIGLIMARRMTLEGMEVEGVYELMPSPGGLRRNIVQCLDDYGIPLHLSTTVTQVHGKKRVEGVTVAKIDARRRQIAGSERFIPCDLLVLSVGLIPENELSRDAGLRLDPITSGPVVDNFMATSAPGIFAAGNVSAVFDLADYVSETGEMAARGAAEFIRNPNAAPETANTVAGDNVAFVLPQRVRKNAPTGNLYLRIKKVMRNVDLTVRSGGKEVYRKRHPVAAPPEMLSAPIPEGPLGGDIVVSVEEK